MNFVAPRGLQRRDTWVKALVAVVLILILLLDAAILYRVYVRRMGNALDYYPFWAGGREIVWNRDNPYDRAFMLSVQEAIYGRPALPGENQHGYAYPAYSPFVVLPFISLPFDVSASFWIACQQALVVTTVVLLCRATGRSIGRWRLLLLCLAAMIFRYSMITFVLGQTSIWVLTSLAVALWAAHRRHNVLAGVALAVGAIKPQLVLLPALALLVSQPSRPRRSTAATLGGALVLLVGCSFLFIGPWIADYWQQLQAYQRYSTTEFPVVALTEAWLSPMASQILNLAVILTLLGILGAILWRSRGSGRVALPVAFAVVVTQLVVPQTGTYNLALLILPAAVALQRLGASTLRGHWLDHIRRALVWADLLIVPWLLWPLVQYGAEPALDQIIVPMILLLALPGDCDVK
jgi:hypothetical protein